jgi:hypothetical protein
MHRKIRIRLSPFLVFLVLRDQIRRVQIRSAPTELIRKTVKSLTLKHREIVIGLAKIALVNQILFICNLKAIVFVFHFH